MCVISLERLWLETNKARFLRLGLGNYTGAFKLHSAASTCSLSQLRAPCTWRHSYRIFRSFCFLASVASRKVARRYSPGDAGKLDPCLSQIWAQIALLKCIATRIGEKCFYLLAHLAHRIDLQLLPAGFTASYFLSAFLTHAASAWQFGGQPGLVNVFKTGLESSSWVDPLRGKCGAVLNFLALIRPKVNADLLSLAGSSVIFQPPLGSRQALKKRCWRLESSDSGKWVFSLLALAASCAQFPNSVSEYASRPWRADQSIRSLGLLQEILSACHWKSAHFFPLQNGDCVFIVHLLLPPLQAEACVTWWILWVEAH